MHVQFLDIPPSICGPWEEQEFHLDVRCQVEEREDLSQSGWCDLGIACECGLVGDLASSKQLVAVDRQRHEAADAGDFAIWSLGAGRGRSCCWPSRRRVVWNWRVIVLAVLIAF